MSVMIATPTTGTICPETVKSLSGLLITEMDKGDYGEIYIPSWEFVYGYDVASARNKLVRIAKDKYCSHILFVDDDVTFGGEYLQQAWDDNCDVLLGWYPHRSKSGPWDGRTNLCKLGEFDFKDQYTADELNDVAGKNDPVIQVHGGGLGFALIDLAVFDVLPEPWFKWTDGTRGPLSEDLWFCWQCQKAGIDVYADARLKCGHLMRYVEGA